MSRLNRQVRMCEAVLLNHKVGGEVESQELLWRMGLAKYPSK